MWYLRDKPGLDYEAERFLEEADEAQVQLKVLVTNDFDLVVTRDDRRSVRVSGETVSLPEVVIPRTGSGTDSYTRSVLRHLERLQVPVLNTAEAIEASGDKMYSVQILRQHHIPVPHTMLVRFPVDSNEVEREIGFPCVIKVLRGSYGKGIHLVRDKIALEEVMEFIASLKSPLRMLLQEYVGFSPGVDVRVMVVGGRVIGAMKRSAERGDFRANLSRGGSGEPFPLDDHLIFFASETAKALQLDIAGVDFLIDEHGYKVCEANSAPGFQGFEKYCDLNVAKEILTYATLKANSGSYVAG